MNQFLLGNAKSSWRTLNSSSDRFGGSKHTTTSVFVTTGPTSRYRRCRTELSRLGPDQSIFRTKRGKLR